MKIRNAMPIACLTGLALAIVFCFNLNTLIKIAIEQTFTKSLAVETTLSEIAFNPSNGYLKLNGFEINNPKGFSTPKLLQVRDFAIQIKPDSLLSDRLKIEKIQLKGINLNIEQQLTRNNVQEILGNANNYRQSIQNSRSGSEKRFDLHSVTVDNISVNLHLSQLGVGSFSGADYTLIELQNLNYKNYGVLIMSEIFTKLVSLILKNAIAQNKASIPKQIPNLLSPFLAQG